MLSEEVKFSVKGREYSVKYPTVGQYYQIEAMKQSLSRGMYNSMVTSPSFTAQHALDMIDIEATLVILIPDFIKDLKVKNFGELDIRDYKEIRDEFVEKVQPYFKEVADLLQGVGKEKSVADVIEK